MLGDSYEDCVDIMLDYLKNFGITSLKDSKTGDINEGDRRFPALTLGGMTYGVSPLEMASAYGALANGGVYIEPTIFTSITTYDGQTLVNSNPDEHQVVDEQVAYVITDMLKAVITEGIGGAASIGGQIEVAGKTGTTNGKLDAWFVGYTPYYVASTYIGDDAGKKDPNTLQIIPRRGVIGSSSTTAKLWSKVMKKVHANLVPAKFTQPDGVYFTKINLIDGGTSSSGVSAAFLDGTAPSRVSSQPTPQNNREEENTDNNTNAGDGAEPPTPNDNTNPPPTTTPDNNTNNNGNTEENTENNTNNGGNTDNPGNNTGDSNNNPAPQE